MDSEDRGKAKAEVSVLQGDEFFHNRILSRNSLVGSSSGLYYRCNEGVPFKWEMQPGKPINPPENDIIPPLSPPPAALSLGLPRSPLDEPKCSNRSRVCFSWMRSKKNVQGKKVQARSQECDKFQRFEFCSCDGELLASPHDSSSLSSSSCSSFNGPSLRSSPLRRPSRDLLGETFGCSRWNIAAILVYIAKRL